VFPEAENQGNVWKVPFQPSEKVDQEIQPIQVDSLVQPKLAVGGNDRMLSIEKRPHSVMYKSTILALLSRRKEARHMNDILAIDANRQCAIDKLLIHAYDQVHPPHGSFDKPNPPTAVVRNVDQQGVPQPDADAFAAELCGNYGKAPHTDPISHQEYGAFVTGSKEPDQPGVAVRRHCDYVRKAFRA
jgi:hypothetical protein